MSWCTIESDPGVFTELLEKFGVQDVQVEEVYTLDDGALTQLQPVHGLIFLFKWQRDAASATADGVFMLDDPSDCGDVVFIKQVVNNACGTIALLHVLLNAQGVAIGENLSTFKTFVSGLGPADAGTALGQYDPIRIAHNEFAHPEPFEVEERIAREDDDVYHFVAYVAVNGIVYELDGLKQAPRVLGGVGSDGDWLSVAAPAVNARMAEYSASEIRFNLLALVADTRRAATARAEAAFDTAATAYDALLAMGAAGDVADPRTIPGASKLGAPVTEPMAGDAAALKDAVQVASVQLADALSVLRDEQAKREEWRIENERRRFNFVPFLLELTAGLARAGKLMPMLEAGKKRAADARERARAERSAAKAADKAAAGAH